MGPFHLDYFIFRKEIVYIEQNKKRKKRNSIELAGQILDKVEGCVRKNI